MVSLRILRIKLILIDLVVFINILVLFMDIIILVVFFHYYLPLASSYILLKSKDILH